MFCPKCGNNLKEGVRFCSKCGSPVRQRPAMEQPAPVPEAPAVEKPVVEKPVVEQPVVEEPAPEQPVVEEPVVEESVVIEQPVVEEPVPEQPVVEELVAEQPAAEQPAPVVEEPAAEQPAPVVEEPAAEQPAEPEPQPIRPQPVRPQPVYNRPMENRQQQDFSGRRPFMNNSNNNGPSNFNTSNSNPSNAGGSTGKVFKESTNIYQDQAKILFDYYKSAAEKIVSEEVAEERNAKDLNARLAEAQKKMDKSKILAIVGLVIAAAGGIGAIFMIFMLALTAVGAVIGIRFLVDYLGAKKDIETIRGQLAESEQKYRSIRRDYHVDKMGVVYVPVATRVPFENKSFLLDHTGSVQDTSFDLNVIRKPEEFQEAVSSLSESMESLPVVENNKAVEEVNTAEYSTSMQNVVLNDYVGNIDRQVRNVSYLLDDSDEVSVSIPAIEPESEKADFIREYATSNTGSYPVLNTFDQDFSDKISTLESLNTLRGQLQNEGDADENAYMKMLMQHMADTVQTFTKTKNYSSGKLIDYTSSILGLVMKSAYTQYSPALEAEEIERIRQADFNYKTAVNDYTPFNLHASSEVKYDMFSNNWVAEDGTRTSMPFGMHQIDEEIFSPVISALMEENRVERLRVYADIEKEKRNYLDRWSSETGNYFRDNRGAADDLITHMREAYADYMSAHSMYQSLKDTSTLMKNTRDLENSEVKELDEQAEMIAGFEMQAAQCNKEQESFSDFMDRIQENIENSTNEFAHVEYYEGSLRDSLPHETAVALSSIHDLDPRRKQLIGVSPYVANNAQLPPTPMVSEELNDHIGIDLVQQVAEDLTQMSLENMQQPDEIYTDDSAAAEQ